MNAGNKICWIISGLNKKIFAHLKAFFFKKKKKKKVIWMEMMTFEKVKKINKDLDGLNKFLRSRYPTRERDFFLLLNIFCVLPFATVLIKAWDRFL